MSAHLSKTGKPGGQPICNRGTRCTSGISVPADRWINEPVKCGHCMRTMIGQELLASAALAKVSK